MKIYTCTGDDGTTGLFGGTRVSKADLRVETYGTIDEANAAIGYARIVVSDDELASVLERIQADLFVIGAEIASGENAGGKLGFNLVSDQDVQGLEQVIDAWDSRVPPLRTFILPGGSEGGGRLHLARTVARRAERRLVELGVRTSVRPEVVKYVNRLSDLLFVLARCAVQMEHGMETAWTPSKR